MQKGERKRLRLLQNIILKEYNHDIVMDKDDIFYAIEEYTEGLSTEEQKLFKWYFIDLTSCRDIGVRMGLSGAGVASRVKVMAGNLTPTFDKRQIC